MNLAKAIEVQSASLKGTWPTPNTDLNDAMKLLIEAGKVVLWNRTHKYPLNTLRLPGETED